MVRFLVENSLIDNKVISISLYTSHRVYTNQLVEIFVQKEMFLMRQ